MSGQPDEAAIEVVPLDAAFGAEIRGLDLARPLDETRFRVWSAALERHAILVLHDQRITDEQLVAASRWFGPLEDFPDPKDQAGGLPMVLRVSNIDRDTGAIKPVDDVGHKSFTLGTSDWHIDSSYRRVPSKASLLYGRELPAEGGDTMFCNLAMAFDALPADRKATLDSLTVIHDFDQARRRFGLPPRPEAVRKATPPARHPLAPRLPDGRRSLHIGMHAARVEGLSEAESRALLDELAAWATQPQFVYRHQWRLGDLVMWDNRCTMHKAMPYDLANARRLLHRTTIVGERAPA